MNKQNWLRIVHPTLHFAAYYAIWVCCLTAAKYGQVSAGIAVSLCILFALYIWQARVMHDVRGLLSWCFLLTLAGALIDSVMLALKLVHFLANSWSLAPPWLMPIWASFAFFLFATSKYYFHRYGLAALTAFFGFPPVYFSSNLVGLTVLPHGLLALLPYAVAWALMLPLSLYIYNLLHPTLSATGE